MLGSTVKSNGICTNGRDNSRGPTGFRVRRLHYLTFWSGGQWFESTKMHHAVQTFLSERPLAAERQIFAVIIET
jgi:hypothetical protein